METGATTTDGGSPLIHLKDLNKVFYTEEVETHALSSIHLSIASGEFVSIAGPPGCGKTTMLSILGLLDSPTGGVYLLDGEPVADLSASQRAKIRNQAIGFIFQAFNLMTNLTAMENVMLSAEFAGVSGREACERAGELLERVGLSERTRHRPNQLSGGEQQRVAIARALINGPALVIADEPTGNLDTRTGAGIVELLTSLAGEQTVIIATHDERIAGAADRVVYLSDGLIATEQADAAL